MDPRSATFATYLTMAVFFLQPFGIGAWLALIPHVKEALDLTKSELAVALVGMPLAVLLALQVAGRLVGRLGLRKTMRLGFTAQAGAAVLPLLAGSQWSLFAALAAFGCAVALIEVAFNSYAGRLEAATGRLIMSKCHGFWALGLMVGSLIVAALSPQVPPLALIAAVSILSCALGVAAVLRLPQVGMSDGEGRLPRRRLSQIPLALGLIGTFMFFTTLVEGAMSDWSAIYLVERMPELADSAGIAVSVFSGFLAAGRFVGDALKRGLGAVGLARISAAMATVGIGCLVLPLPPHFTYIGLALTGLGVAAAYPLGVSAVSNLDETYQPANVALMSTAALGGFLLGPPLIGFLGEAVGLRLAFAALLPGLLACLWLAAWLAPAEEARGLGSAGAG